MAAQACWEVMKCERAEDCPAYPKQGFACWNVEGTLCRGQRQGVYSEKVGSCRAKCEFYNGVMTGNIRIV
jgi:hypothetical protein